MDRRIAASLTLTFLSLSIVKRVILFSLFTLIALYVFGVLIDALSEVTTHIASVYTSSDPLTKLIIIVLGVLFFKYAYPVIVRIFKGV